MAALRARISDSKIKYQMVIKAFLTLYYKLIPLKKKERSSRKLVTQ
jgi:hypothetical protein